MGNQLNLAIKW